MYLFRAAEDARGGKRKREDQYATATEQLALSTNLAGYNALVHDSQESQTSLGPSQAC